MIKNKGGNMKKVLEILIFISLLMIVVLYYGWGLSILWNWFIVPLGFPAIGWANGYGIMLVVCMFKEHELKKKINDNEQYKELLFGLVFKPLILIAIGWILLEFSL